MFTLATLTRLAQAAPIRGTANNTLVSLDCFESDHPLNHAGICGTCHQRARDTILGLVQRVRELEEVLARLDAFTWKFVKDHGHDETEYTAWESVHYRAEHLLTPSEPRDVR